MSVPRSVFLALAAGTALVGTAACGHAGRAPAGRPSTSTSAGAMREPPETPGGGRPAWTHAALVRRLDGRRIEVEGRSVRIDAGTVTCGGLGRPKARIHDEPAWTRFRCLQPTFTAGGPAGPDAIFFVEPTGSNSFAVSGQRFTSY